MKLYHTYTIERLANKNYAPVVRDPEGNLVDIKVFQFRGYALPKSAADAVRAWAKKNGIRLEREEDKS